MAKAVYPGSFDPITLGHLDVIRRAARATDKLIIGILRNTKKEPLFSLEERKSMIEDCVKDIENVTVRVFDGMTVDFARENDANIIVRGLRAVSDFEYEMQMALFNKDLCSDLETVFFIADATHSFISSSQVRNIASLGGDISKYVSEPVVKALRRKYQDHT